MLLKNVSVHAIKAFWEESILQINVICFVAKNTHICHKMLCKASKQCGEINIMENRNFFQYTNALKKHSYLPSSKMGENNKHACSRAHSHLMCPIEHCSQGNNMY